MFIFHMPSLKSNTEVTLLGCREFIWYYNTVLESIAAVILSVDCLISCLCNIYEVNHLWGLLWRQSVITTGKVFESANTNSIKAGSINIFLFTALILSTSNLFYIYCAFTRFIWQVSQSNKPKLRFKTRGLHLLIIYRWRQIC